jgi:hypothetical protein
MNRVFTIHSAVKVPDGTTVYPFLNAMDSTSNLPWDLLEGFSVAAGEIAGQSASKIHVMPLVTQVTICLRGLLEVRMKDPASPAPYTLRIVPWEAIITHPGTFLQVINPTKFPGQTLYIVSPAYVFEVDEQAKIVYDDSVVFEESWDELARCHWVPPPLKNPQVTPEARRAAQSRLAEKKKKLGFIM